MQRARQQAHALAVPASDEPHGISLGDVAEQVRLKEPIDDAVEHVVIELGEGTPMRVEAVPERATAKRRPVDTHGAVGDHDVERAVIEHGIGGHVHGDLLLLAETVRAEELHAPLPIDDVTHILGEEAIDGLDVHDEVGRLGRGVPKAQIVKTDFDRNVASTREIVLRDRILVHALELEPNLPATQLHCSELGEHQAQVQTCPVAAELHDQATAAYEALELVRVLVLEQFLG